MLIAAHSHVVISHPFTVYSLCFDSTHMSYHALLRIECDLACCVVPSGGLSNLQVEAQDILSGMPLEYP